MPRPSRIVLLSGALLFLLLLVMGCTRNERPFHDTETNDPYYRRGDQLKRQGRYQEALGAFLQVIDRRDGDAPESHLEAGLIYQQYLKDPIEAIHHYRKYLLLKPGSLQAPLVRGRIDAAMREFARTLPAQPVESQTAQLDLLNRIDQLQKENLQLKQEIALLKKLGLGGADTSAAAGTAPETPLVAPVLPLKPAAGSAAKVVTTQANLLPPDHGVAPAAPEKAPPPAGRRHVVVAGDTLYKIAQRYYGNGAKWKDILEANRDQLKNQSSIRPGMELRIP